MMHERLRRATVWLVRCGVVLLAALLQQSVWTDAGAPAAGADPGAVTRPGAEPELPAPSVPEKATEPVVRVKVFPRLLPRSLTLPEARFPRAQYIVHLDDQGRVTPPPPGAAARAPRAPAPRFAYTFVGRSAGGGIGSDVSHLRSYSYAAVGPDGVLRTGCVQGSLEEARAKAGALAGEDGPHAGEGSVKHDVGRD